MSKNLPKVWVSITRDGRTLWKMRAYGCTRLLKAEVAEQMLESGEAEYGWDESIRMRP